MRQMRLPHALVDRVAILGPTDNGKPDDWSAANGFQSRAQERPPGQRYEELARTKSYAAPGSNDNAVQAADPR
jgi:hypothetical protein